MLSKEIFSDKNKLRESWLKNNLPIEYNIVKKFQMYNNFLELKFSNILYNYINNISDVPRCEQCSIKSKRFVGFGQGYNKFCSKQCASKNSLSGAIKKRRENTFKKHGVNHTSQLYSVKLKQSETNILKYGFKSPTLNMEIKDKQIKTMQNKYGVNYSGESKLLHNKSLETRFNKYKIDVIERYKILNIIDIPREGELIIKCDICNNIYNIRTELLSLRYFRYKTITCLHCNPLNTYKYTGQNEIYEFLKSFNIRIEKDDRKILSGKEIDIFLPDYNVGIEFNGLYWHSDLYKPNNYHLDKKNKCIEKNINLIHIWEDDWIYKKEIVKSRILNLINFSERKIYARKCEIKEIENSIASEFLKINHLQGSIKSNYNLGLYLNNELVSLMSFGKFRRALGKNIESDCWELYRFCNKLNTNVIGSFSKLISKFEKCKNPKKIITYANKDWGNIENVYIKNNFTFLHETPPNYWYFDKEIKRIHRFNYRKDKLVNEGFDKNKTEKEIMRDRGFNIVYDCGSYKFEKFY